MVTTAKFGSFKHRGSGNIAFFNVSRDLPRPLDKKGLVTLRVGDPVVVTSTVVVKVKCFEFVT